MQIVLKDNFTKMKRIFHHYLKWEDFQCGMWRTASSTEKEILLPLAIEFTGNAELYGSFMLRVIEEWPVSCEHNLTDTSQNRKAWIGHAATCLALNCPEDITRKAWHSLMLEQQDAANLKAKEAIQLWCDRHEAKNNSVRGEVGKTRLPGRNTGLSPSDTGIIGESSFVSENLSSNIQE